MNKVLKSFMHVSVGVALITGYLVGVQVARHNLGPDASEKCFYAASSSYYIHDDSWTGLSACKGLSNFDLVAVKARIDNMRSR